MYRNCSKCKHSIVDYYWDDELEDEYTIYTCENGNETDSDFECKDYEEYKPTPYKETDTKCDKCPRLETCKIMGNVINCTAGEDTREHYIIGIGCNCEKEISNITREMKLSECLKYIDSESTKDIMTKGIEHFGDITFGEFVLEGKFKELLF